MERQVWKNTILLAAASLGLRGLGMVWQVWLAGRIGAAGIGLWQLVMSTGSLFATIAISGIRYTATRLLAEELGLGRPSAVGAVTGRAAVYAVLFGCAAGAGLWLCAFPIGAGWISDLRAVPALRWLAFSMPFLSLSAVLGGYFTAVGRVWKSAGEQIAEQLLRMGLTALALRRPVPDPGTVCAVLTAAGAAADALGCGAMGILYASDRRRYGPGTPGAGLTRRMIRMAVPLALSAYARSALGTFRQMLVPKGLRLSGFSATQALAGYGVITGMALPVLYFPTCLPAAISEVLLPVLTEAQVSGQWERLRRMVRRLLRATLFFSLTVGGVFFLAADWLGGVLYHSAEAGRFLRILAPLVPFLYTDMVTDGCLKGLGEMTRSMIYNVAESTLGLLLTGLLLPRWALGGYVFTLYVCEIFNFSLSLRRLWIVLRPSGGKKQDLPVLL